MDIINVSSELYLKMFRSFKKVSFRVCLFYTVDEIFSLF